MPSVGGPNHCRPAEMLPGVVDGFVYFLLRRTIDGKMRFAPEDHRSIGCKRSEWIQTPIPAEVIPHRIFNQGPGQSAVPCECKLGDRSPRRMYELLLGLFVLSPVGVQYAHCRDRDLVGVHGVHSHLRFAAPARCRAGQQILFGYDFLVRSRIRFLCAPDANCGQAGEGERGHISCTLHRYLL